MNAVEILDVLDNSNDGFYNHFVSLNDGNSYLLDVRMNLFRNDEGQWAIAIERLGENQRAGGIALEIFYYGNCLINLDEYNNRHTNAYYLLPVESGSYRSTFEDGFFNPEAGHWIVREQKISVRFDADAFAQAGVVLKAYNKGKISPEEIARVVVENNREVFRATEAELRKSIPASLGKIGVIDQWHHKDFMLKQVPAMSEDALRYTFEFNQKLSGMGGMTFEQFAAQFRHQMRMSDDYNRQQWENNRPGVYETWQQIAQVLETGNVELYKPTLPPNTHWSNWPESGGL